MRDGQAANDVVPESRSFWNELVVNAPQRHPEKGPATRILTRRVASNRREDETSFRFRRVLGWVLRPVLRFSIRHVPLGDPWEPITRRFLTPGIFGPGSLRMFPWYFQGSSAVQVRTPAEVCQWLTECQYVSDDDLFNESDFWQHPRTFENIRKGDCEDHALWAWRKLVELGHGAEFFVGQWFEGGSDEHRLHAWVVFEENGTRFVLEAVEKDQTAMIRPLADAHASYAPHFSVDAAFTMQSYGGYLAYLKDHERRRARRVMT